MSHEKSCNLVLALFTLLTLQACVSKSTFEEMAGKAHTLDTTLTDLQGRYQTLQNQHSELQASHADLQARQAELQARHAAVTAEKARLEKERADLLEQKAALTTTNRELEGILAAKEDSLSRKIAEQRQELTARQTEYAGRLGDQSRRITDLEGRLAQVEKQLAATNTDNSKLTDELRQLREEKENEARRMTSTYQALLDKMKSEIDKGQITISELKGKLTVNMVEAILFDSGKAEVKPDGLLVLQRVIDILKGVSGKSIRIEGHTDNVQIIGLLAQKYPTNWELSAARAVNVARFLQERGIEPVSLNAVAHGEYKPVADNISEAGRARNRRIEIILADRE